MRKVILVLILIIAVTNSWAQNQKTESFYFSATSLNRVLIEIEKKFEVKYSFVDSIVKYKNVSLPLKKYTLNQLNDAIGFQTSLNIVKIDNRYYSIYKKEDKEQRLRKLFIGNDFYALEFYYSDESFEKQIIKSSEHVNIKNHFKHIEKKKP